MFSRQGVNKEFSLHSWRDSWAGEPYSLVGIHEWRSCEWNLTWLFTNPLTASPLAFMASLPKQKHSHTKSHQLCRLNKRQLSFTSESNVDCCTMCTCSCHVIMFFFFITASSENSFSSDSSHEYCVPPENSFPPEPPAHRGGNEDTEGIYVEVRHKHRTIPWVQI